MITPLERYHQKRSTATNSFVSSLKVHDSCYESISVNHDSGKVILKFFNTAQFEAFIAETVKNMKTKEIVVRKPLENEDPILSYLKWKQTSGKFSVNVLIKRFCEDYADWWKNNYDIPFDSTSSWDMGNLLSKSGKYDHILEIEKHPGKPNKYNVK